jgi:hypothetical protein
MILEVVTDLESVPRSAEALMFAIYLSSITSMNDKHCRVTMAESKSALLARFSNATQQALVNAEFLKSSCLVVLQALTLYLVSFPFRIAVVRSCSCSPSLDDGLSLGKA